MMAVTSDLCDLYQAPPSTPYNNGNRMSHVKSNKDEPTTSTKILKQTVEQLEKSKKPTGEGANQSAKQVKQIDPENLSDRDFLIQEVVKQKGVSKEVAEAEIDFFY